MVTINGINIKEYGLICQPGHEHPLTAVIENKTLAIPGKVGLYYFGSEIREKTFTLPLVLIERNKTIKLHKLREFTSALFDEFGKPKDLELIFDYLPDVYYKVRCGNQIIPELLLNTGEFELPLTAYDPYGYSTVYADEVRWGSNDITFMSHYKLGHPGSDGVKMLTAPTTLSIHNDGLANKPVIEVSGSATNLIISANGYEINLGTFAGVSWSIDCNDYTVRKDGASTFLANLREFILLPGSNQIQISGNGIDISIHIKLRDKYN